MNINSTFTGGYRLTGNFRTGDRESDDSGTATVKAWNPDNAAIVAATCTEDQRVRINVPGVGAKAMNVCSVP